MRWLRRSSSPVASQPHPADRPLTVAVIGSPGVGKSALMHSLNSRMFELNATGARESDYYDTRMERPYVSGRLWTLYFTEITSDARDANRTYAYPSIDIFVVCFASGDQDSYYEALNRHIPEIRLLRPDGPPVILIETKHDHMMMTHGSNTATGELDWTWHAARMWKRTLASMRWHRRAYRLTHPKQLLQKRFKAAAPMSNGINPFDWLPDELLMLIISYLHTPDLARLAQTCGRMRRLVSDDLIWPSRSRIQLFGGIVLAGTHRCSAKTKAGIESLPYAVARAYFNAYHRQIQPVVTKSLAFDNAHDIIEQLRVS